jgi:outer membrane protein assembly factor BamB
MWIIATTVSSDGRRLCGMTYYHNDFFAVDLESGQVVFSDQLHAGVWNDSACSHTIVCDSDGVVYGSCSEGYLFTYDREAQRLM